MYDRVGLGILCILATGFTCSLATGLIITYATSGGINEGAVPLAVAACILVGSIFLSCLYKLLVCIENR